MKNLNHRHHSLVVAHQVPVSDFRARGQSHLIAGVIQPLQLHLLVHKFSIFSDSAALWPPLALWVTGSVVVEGSVLRNGVALMLGLAMTLVDHVFLNGAEGREALGLLVAPQTHEPDTDLKLKNYRVSLNLHSL